MMDFISTEGRTIAVVNSQPDEDRGVGIMWCGGFASTMEGTKATAFAQWAQQRGANFLRFDYSGCGASSGDFFDGTLSAWKEDARAVFETYALPQQILIASSMGAWVAWDILLKYPEQIGAVVFIAPAPDFTEKLIGRKTKEKIFKAGTLGLDDPAGPLSQTLIENGAKELVLDKKINLSCPVHIFLGTEDEVVPLSHVQEVMAQIESPSVQLTLIKGGDHSLSAPHHFALLQAQVAALYDSL